MKISVIHFCLLFLILISLGCSSTAIPNVPDKNEIVMHKGMTITAITPSGGIIIAAGDGLERSYKWDGATRSFVASPMRARWFGSMGIRHGAAVGDHWKEHNGITRGYFEEGQQHFDTIEDALEWLKIPYNSINCVYKSDGLVVCYSKNLKRRQINIYVWQILIGGKIVSEFQETYHEAHIQSKAERFSDPSKSYKQLKNICHVGGEKPKSLPGSQDHKIKVEFLTE